MIGLSDPLGYLKAVKRTQYRRLTAPKSKGYINRFKVANPAPTFENVQNRAVSKPKHVPIPSFQHFSRPIIESGSNSKYTANPR